jgi:protocatechuate 3,4-dioxygenase beta subunit
MISLREFPPRLSCFSEGRRMLVRAADGARFSLPVLIALFFILSGATRATQDQKGQPELRTVHGTVEDKDENPVPSGVVYLKNVKTEGVKTYIADDTGSYRFSGLDPNVDYEIHAEHNEMTSSVRTISSYDSRRDINLTLKLSHKKNEPKTGSN